MKRLTYDDPQWNTENMLNIAFRKNDEIYLRGVRDHGKEDVSLVEYCKEECSRRCGRDLANVSVEDFVECMDCDCSISLLYFVSCGSAMLRERLKEYEDKGLDTEGKPLEPGHWFERRSK